MRDFLYHLFVPRESNNHRARLLHAQPLLLLVSILLVINFLSPRIEQQYPSILGISADISVDELVNLTNLRRAEAGLEPLTLNGQLSQAAQLKANDMFAKNYWAHTAPDGTTPWVFIKSAGYEYIYAGENLARGFTNASDAVDAWMASPGHKDNMLSKNYSEIGFAVSAGNLTGDETVLIVEMFGSRPSSAPAIGSSQTQQAPIVTQSLPSVTPLPTFIVSALETTPVPTIIPTVVPTTVVRPLAEAQPTSAFFVASIKKEPLVSRNDLSRLLALSIGALFLFILILDIIVIERKQIVRIVSHNIDHIMFLGIIVLTILLFGKGAII